MKTFRLLFPLVALFFCFQFLSAQEEDEITAKKYENPEYYMITYLKFHSGKARDAKKIIDEQFVPAGEEAGVPGPVMHLDLITGEWDMILVWQLDEGVESLNWEVSPTDVKWQTVFFERVGGKEKGTAIGQEYGSYIQHSKTELARKH